MYRKIASYCSFQVFGYDASYIVIRTTNTKRYNPWSFLKYEEQANLEQNIPTQTSISKRLQPNVRVKIKYINEKTIP